MNTEVRREREVIEPPAGQAMPASGIPVLSIGELPRGAVDGVLLSSVTYEADMRRAAQAAGWPTLPLYADDAASAIDVTARRRRGAA